MPPLILDDGAERVVGLPEVRVAEHLIRLVILREPLRSCGVVPVLVRVVLKGEVVIGPPDGPNRAVLPTSQAEVTVPVQADVGGLESGGHHCVGDHLDHRRGDVELLEGLE